MYIYIYDTLFSLRSLVRYTIPFKIAPKMHYLSQDALYISRSLVRCIIFLKIAPYKVVARLRSNWRPLASTTVLRPSS